MRKMIVAAYFSASLLLPDTAMGQAVINDCKAYFIDFLDNGSRPVSMDPFCAAFIGTAIRSNLNLGISEKSKGVLSEHDQAWLKFLLSRNCMDQNLFKMNEFLLLSDGEQDRAALLGVLGEEYSIKFCSSDVTDGDDDGRSDDSIVDDGKNLERCLGGYWLPSIPLRRVLNSKLFIECLSGDFQ